VSLPRLFGGGELVPCNVTNSAQEALPPDEGLAVGFGYLALWLCGKLRPERPPTLRFPSHEFPADTLIMPMLLIAVSILSRAQL